ncbi:hypothetical protein [Paenibacillus sp. 4624]|uniref:hypothetical protein n=1 Tax=Paenibacillus sp. 4624 TaxID=3156453 RepID=UPI003D19698B
MNEYWIADPGNQTVHVCIPLRMGDIRRATCSLKRNDTIRIISRPEHFAGCTLQTWISHVDHISVPAHVRNSNDPYGAYLGDLGMLRNLTITSDAILAKTASNQWNHISNVKITFLMIVTFWAGLKYTK